jgi:hypothetical protein
MRTRFSMILLVLTMLLSAWFVFFPRTCSFEVENLVFALIRVSYTFVLVLLLLNIALGFYRRKSLGALVIASLAFVISAFLMTGDPR